MKRFLHTHQVFLTPLSPIHIGCGEDFEPTNYVIDDQVLYHFDPAQLNLSQLQKDKLFNLVRSNQIDLLAIQRFFLEQKKQAVALAHYFANVPPAVENHWQSKVGKVANNEKNGNKVVANLAIERTAYLPYHHQAYIPASGLKGALATAMLDYEHQRKGNPAVERNEHKALLERYIGTFSDSKLRHIKFGDFTPKSAVHSMVYFSVNFKKKIGANNKQEKGVSLRRECILAGQYRAFKSDLTLEMENKQTPHLNEELKKLHQFHQAIFVKECEILNQLGLIDQKWQRTVTNLLKNPNSYLVRLGKNGAESKSYRGSGIAQIDVSQGKKIFKENATTIWLAAQDDKQTTQLLPFGWALLEMDPQTENTELKQWCESQLAQETLFNKEQILQARQALMAEQQAEKAREAEKQQALAQQALAEQQRLATLSENQLMIEQFIERHQSAEVKAHTDSVVFREAKQLIQTALEQHWSNDDNAYLQQHLQLESGILAEKVKINSDKAKKEFKKLLNKLSQTS